jgi:NAD(P)-dependent dehydrogenase (short-subunit alcohol dehydrogenase family)
MGRSMAQTIIVTGGFGILGRRVAASFAAQGDRIARVDFATAADEALEGALDIGNADLTDSNVASQVVADVIAAFGSLDVLVNIAGGFAWQRLADDRADNWARMFAMNATTCVNMTKAALPFLKKATSARIINIGAGSAIVAAAGMGGYAASKAAVHKLTESLADEMQGVDMTINAVLPSIIDTPTNRSDMPDADFGLWVQPAAIADVIMFLASPAARSISGALIPITRGAG